MKLVDLTQGINNQMTVYPGDEEVQLIQIKQFTQDGYTNSRLTTGMHVGTHIDGPMHLTSSSQYIDEIDLNQFIGRGYLLDARGENVITKKDLSVQSDDIVLIYTGFDKWYGKVEYYEQHPVLSLEFAKYLIERKVKMVGLDCPSPDYYPFDIHQLLLEHGILIIENLTHLNQLINKNFEIMAFPLKVKADSSLTRVVARIL